MNENIRCILLNGKSGSGKSTVAREFAGQVQHLKRPDGTTHTSIHWDHKYLAAPLAILHTIRTDTQGLDAKSRQLWLIHNALTDLFPYGSIDYEELIKLVYDIYEYPMKTIVNEETGKLVRDRNFMTDVADVCHKLYPNVFAHKLIRDIEADFRVLDKDPKWEETGVRPQYNVVVSDLRLEAELEAFQGKFEKLTLVKFNVSELEARRRLIERDTFALTETQSAHPTQSTVFDNSLFDLVIETDTLSADDVIAMTKDALFLDEMAV